MPRLTDSFTAADIRLEVFVGVPASGMAAALATGQPIPPSVIVTAILDTGSNITAVAPRVLRQLGLTSSRQGRTRTAAGPILVDLFDVSLGLPTGGGLTAPVMIDPQLSVSALAAELDDADVLFGLDPLLNCRLLIDGPARTFALDV